MITNILFFVIISCGSVFAASFYKRKYEEALPITVFSIILIQYVFALLGNLRLGAYAVFVSATILILYSILNVIAKKAYKMFLSYFLTPGFLIFVMFYVVLNLANVGKLASTWDEFSHWADVVKVMSTINDLATNPFSGSSFKSYVPAMSLFQYNLQVLNQIIKQDATAFSEWRLYLCYQVATYALLFPVYKNIGWKSFYKAILAGVAIFLLPSMFNGFYNVIYIDVYLGILAGFALFLLINIDTLDRFSLLSFFLSLSVLVLTKDAGFPLALFLCVMYVFKHIIYNRGWKIRIPYILTAVIVVLIPKLSWNYHLSINSVTKAFGTPINLGGFFGSIFSKKPEDYRWVTFDNFQKKLTQAEFSIGDTNLKMSYILMLVLLITMIYILLREKSIISSVWCISAINGIILGTGLYIVGMVAMYMFKFSEYEATMLASFGRYICIYIYMLSTASWLMYLSIVLQKGVLSLNNAYIGIMLLMMLSTTSASQFVFGKYKLSSEVIRKPYTQVSDMINETIGDTPQKIYIVSQEDRGFDYWVLKYSMRPHIVNSGFSWSIGKPFYEGDIWTKKLNKEEWHKELQTNYDYVLLYKTNSYFKETYASVFNDPSTIMDRMLYKVDKKTGNLMLEGFEFKLVFEKREVFKGANEFLQTIDIAPLIDKYGLIPYRISFEARSAVPGELLMYQQNGSTARYAFQNYFDTTTAYKRYSLVVIPTEKDLSVQKSILAFYGKHGTGIIPEVKNIVIEVLEKENN